MKTGGGGGETVLRVRRKKYYPICFNNMAPLCLSGVAAAGPLSVSPWTVSLFLHLPGSVFTISAEAVCLRPFWI